jgi:hypothetical protein
MIHVPICFQQLKKLLLLVELVMIDEEQKLFDHV